MKPTDLDDLVPLEPDDDALARVHARSRTFRRRRRSQRFVSVASGLLLVALAVGIAYGHDGSGKEQVTTPVPTATTTTIAPKPTVTDAMLFGKWRPVSIAGYHRPLTGHPLAFQPYLTFDGKGGWTGTNDCNSAAGSYQLGAGGTFRIGQHLQTAVACAGSLPGLPFTASRVALSNGQLTFFDRTAQEIAHYVRTGITMRIQLPSNTMVAGSSMSGLAIVRNDTGKVLRSWGCGSEFGLVLERPQENLQSVPGPACLQAFTISTGESTYPASVEATYRSCTAVLPAVGNRQCTPTTPPKLPPLPTGNYRAVLFDNSHPAPDVPAIAIRVVKPVGASSAR